LYSEPLPPSSHILLCAYGHVFKQSPPGEGGEDSGSGNREGRGTGGGNGNEGDGKGSGDGGGGYDFGGEGTGAGKGDGTGGTIMCRTPQSAQSVPKSHTL